MLPRQFFGYSVLMLPPDALSSTMIWIRLARSRASTVVGPEHEMCARIDASVPALARTTTFPLEFSIRKLLPLAKGNVFWRSRSYTSRANAASTQQKISSNLILLRISKPLLQGLLLLPI